MSLAGNITGMSSVSKVSAMISLFSFLSYSFEKIIVIENEILFKVLL
jgi:hypothetical protein